MANTRDASTSTDWIASRVVIIVLFATFGILGNGLVIRICRREKSGSKKAPSCGSQLYILAMAWIDLTGCMLLLPQTPFWELGVLPNVAHAVQNVLVKNAYLFVQLAMTFDRIFAVFRPHEFLQMRRRTNRALAVLFLLQQLTIYTSMTVNATTSTTNYIGVTVHAMTFALGLVTMLVAYPAIAARLYSQNRHVRETYPASHHRCTDATSIGRAVISEGQQRRGHHVKTLKIYVGVLVLYLATVIPVALLAANINSTHLWVAYVYYINNIGNPFIYYAFNDRFRDEVKAMFRSRSC